MPELTRRQLLGGAVAGGLLAAMPVGVSSARAGTPGSTLRAKAANHPELALGSVADEWAIQSGGTYTSRLDSEFNTVTATCWWHSVEATRNVFDYYRTDIAVDFASSHGQKIRGHNLCWHQELPDWLVNGNFSRDELISILQNHVTTIVDHYRGRIFQWDVVNEPFNDDGSRRQSIWQTGIGPDYIEIAFAAARAADPACKLFLNEYGMEYPGSKRDAMVALVADFKARGVPVDGVGFQCHYGTSGLSSTDANSLQSGLARYDTLGVETACTEIDVGLPVRPSKADLTKQATVYGVILNAALATLSCKTVVVWGFDDGHSWIPDAFPGRGAACLYRADYSKKPAYNKWYSIL